MQHHASHAHRRSLSRASRNWTAAVTRTGRRRTRILDGGGHENWTFIARRVAEAEASPSSIKLMRGMRGADSTWWCECARTEQRETGDGAEHDHTGEPKPRQLDTQIRVPAGEGLPHANPFDRVSPEAPLTRRPPQGVPPPVDLQKQLLAGEEEHEDADETKSSRRIPSGSVGDRLHLVRRRSASSQRAEATIPSAATTMIAP